MKIIFEAPTLLPNWFVHFPVDWTCEQMPQKGDKIIALQLLPDNTDLFEFFKEKVVENSKKQHPIRTDYKGYSYDYEDAAFKREVQGNAYDPHILKRGCYIVGDIIWEKIDDEVGVIISLGEL